MKSATVMNIVMIAGLALAFSPETASHAQAAPCTNPEYKQFDFWLGDWEVFDFSSGKQGPLAGTNRVVKALGNCVVQENWKGSQGGNGSSFNMYQPLEQKWHQTWVDDSGTLLLLKGEFRDAKMVLEGKHPGQRAGETISERITWNQVNGNPDQVRQRWEQSRDGGSTWQIAFDGLYVRQK